MKAKILLRRMLVAFSVVVVLVVALLLGCNAIVVHNASGRIFTNVDAVAETDVALVLGTSPTSRITGKSNYFYEFRMDAAAALYRAGRVRNILVSGDAHSHQGVDETACMRRSLEERGVPAAAILLDPDGFRTEASIKNARERFGMRSFVVVSQHFHNERALYLADHLGLDFERVEAYDAESPETALSYITYAREYMARVKMFMDLVGR